MTFEQGSGPRGGKAVQIEDGDTLTLADRIEHHYTTGLSTIEMSSLHAARLLKEFRNFFNDGINGNTGNIILYHPDKKFYGRRRWNPGHIPTK
jgi:hypothetical protein